MHQDPGSWAGKGYTHTPPIYIRFPTHAAKHARCTGSFLPFFPFLPAKNMCMQGSLSQIYPKITSKLPWEQLTNGCDIWTRQSHDISYMRDSASVAGERRWLEPVHLVLRRLQDRTHGSCYHVASSSQIKEPYTIPILNCWGLFLLPSLFLCPGKELLSLEEHPNSPNIAIEHESLKWLKQDQPSQLIYVYKSTNMMNIWNGWWYDVYWFWKKIMTRWFSSFFFLAGSGGFALSV